MPNQVVRIGSSFNDKSIEQLNATLNAQEAVGWRFHSVFKIEHRSGCLSLTKQQTYLAVFESEQRRHQD